MTITTQNILPRGSLRARVQAYFTAFGNGDIDSALSMMTDDAVWHIDGVPQVTTVGLWRGQPQIRHWLQSFSQHFSPRVFTVEQFIESKDTVAAFGYFRHSVQDTGNTVSSDFAIRFRFRDGLIAHYQIFEDSALLARAFDQSDRCDRYQISLNGAVYAYTDVGEGPTIFFAHGLFVDRSIFDDQLAELSKNYRCIVPDMPGHGESGYHRDGWTLDNIADDIALMIKELSLGPVVFAGQSQGGMVGIRLAANYPELVERLILIGTSARAEEAERYQDWEKMKRTLLHGSTPEKADAFRAIQQRINAPKWLAEHQEQAEQERAIMMSHDRAGITYALEAATLGRRDIRALLAKVQTPTLVVSGDEDRATPTALSQEIVAGIAHAALLILPGVGHHPPLEAPLALTSAMLDFLQQRH
ncbi:alpha/beta fold hydrolase [Brenneria sp. 4F2]|nr:alpha/beta fold hydrolase [Brenneria bubanii]